MALDQIDRDWIEGLFKSNTCSCGLNETEQKGVSNFVGMVKASGGGDIDKGVEKFRRMSLRDERYVRIARSVEAGVLATITGATLYKFGMWVWDSIIDKIGN